MKKTSALAIPFFAKLICWNWHFVGVITNTYVFGILNRTRKQVWRIQIFFLTDSVGKKKTFSLLTVGNWSRFNAQYISQSKLYWLHLLRKSCNWCSLSCCFFACLLQSMDHYHAPVKFDIVIVLKRLAKNS